MEFTEYVETETVSNFKAFIEHATTMEELSALTSEFLKNNSPIGESDAGNIDSAYRNHKVNVSRDIHRGILEVRRGNSIKGIGLF